MSGRRAVAAVVVALTIGGCDFKEPEVVDSSLCSIASTPAAFDGKKVRLRSRIESDGMHSSWLSDPSCAEVALPVTWDAAEKNTRLRGLIDTIYSRAEHPGTLDKEITASFVGVLYWEQSQRPGRRLDLVDVTDVVIRPRPDSPFAKLPKTSSEESQSRSH